MNSSDNDLSNFSMFDLFRVEVENQVSILNEGLLRLEKEPSNARLKESLMRAAHSLKGAARIVQLDPVVKVAHALEDCFVAAQKGKIELHAEQMDVLLEGIDFLTRAGYLKEQELDTWMEQNNSVSESLVNRISSLLIPKSEPVQKQDSSPLAESEKPKSGIDSRTVRVQAENLDRLLGYAAETSVGANSLRWFSDSLRAIQLKQSEFLSAVSVLHESITEESSRVASEELLRKAEEISRQLILSCNEIETYSRKTIQMTHRLYHEVLDNRMRPFRDGIEAFPRMVRDLSRKLGKNVNFKISGESTKIDRDILERLESPLNHLLRNALDHGIEMPEKRVAAGKPEQGTLTLDAVHKGGMLHVEITDDGQGVDLDRLRQKLIQNQLVTPELADKLSSRELLEFLFLPGFSTADHVTELSGRGVGLDIVYNMVREVGGTIRADSEPGKGMVIRLQLPLTLSILRALIVEIDQELYAFPLSAIDKALHVLRDKISWESDRVCLNWNDQKVQLIPATSILEYESKPLTGDAFVVLISDSSTRYGIVVDRFVAQKDIVVRPLDPRLGKVRDVYAASILEDGRPILILDVQDVMRTIDHQLHSAENEDGSARKRILVVEDSLTVREMTRALLQSRGYEVHVAMDGIDGWNVAKSSRYDLIITDLDMPRWNGIQMVSRIREDSKQKHIPILMVSYKDREEDKKAAFQAGVDKYLSKASFQDDTFLRTIVELIGAAK